ncbi:hypothetical protein [Nostoc sp.]|uniref:hypothetical protein n=1 Tax=Nostoc sp. TaxID=1180 RepID=UPI002FFAE5E6
MSTGDAPRGAFCANVSDDAGLIEMFTLNIDYFKSKQERYPQNHHPARSWISSRIFDSGVRADLSRDYDQNPVSTFYQTLKTLRLLHLENLERVPAIAFRGDRTLQCLDGAL